MPTYRIRYRETVTYETEIIADSKTEARRLIREMGNEIEQGEAIAYSTPIVESISSDD